MAATSSLPENIECPLCLGKGNLQRSEVLERLGMKDFARVAQLSAEEAIRLLTTKEKESEQSRWTKFESELAKRVGELEQKHQSTVSKIKTERDGFEQRLKDIEANHSTVVSNAKQSERLETEKTL